MLLVINRTRSIIKFHVYRISIQKSSRISSIVTLGLVLCQILLQHHIHYRPSQPLPYHPTVNKLVIKKFLCYYLVITIVRKLCLLMIFALQLQFMISLYLTDYYLIFPKTKFQEGIIFG